MNIGYLLQIVNERISDIEALKYIDRNWGQLDPGTSGGEISLRHNRY